MPRLGTLLAAALLCSLNLLAPAQSGEHETLSVEDPWLRVGPPTQRNAAGYLTVHNQADEPAALVGISSPIARTAELHTMEIDDAGLMSLQRLLALEIPAGGRATLAPGGDHLMFIGLESALEAGNQYPVTLTFADGTELTLDFAARLP